MLHQKGIQARVLDMAFIKPYDRNAILKAAVETGRIITVEEHSWFEDWEVLSPKLFRKCQFLSVL